MRAGTFTSDARCWASSSHGGGYPALVAFSQECRFGDRCWCEDPSARLCGAKAQGALAVTSSPIAADPAARCPRAAAGHQRIPDAVVVRGPPRRKFTTRGGLQGLVNVHAARTVSDLDHAVLHPEGANAAWMDAQLTAPRAAFDTVGDRTWHAVPMHLPPGSQVTQNRARSSSDIACQTSWREWAKRCRSPVANRRPSPLAWRTS